MKKDFDFIVSLQRGNFKRYDVISLLLLVIAAAVFLFALSFDKAHSSLYIIAIAVILFQIGYNFYKRKKGEYLDHRIAFLVCCITLFFIPSNSFVTIVIALMYGVAALLERQIKFPEEIGFDQNGITVNTFFKKHYTWDVINNVILKDGLLTIDFKNNKIFQKETEEAVTPVLEKEFNEFCRSQLASGKSKLAVP